MASQVTIKIPNSFGALPGIVRHEVRGEMSQIGEYLKRGVQGQIKAADGIASGILTNSITSQLSGTGLLTLRTNSNDVPVKVATYERGRGAGKRPPPVSAILEWMGFKGLGQDKGLAFVIARSIGIKGTKGRFVFQKTYDAMKDRVFRDIDSAIKRATGKLK